MPEGPSLIIVKENIMQFKGQSILTAAGNASIDMSGLKGKKIKNIKTWGKHLLLRIDNSFFRIHFLLFGSYSINKQTKPDRSIRLYLKFKKGSIYFYTCSVRLLEKETYKTYNWSVDVLSRNWDPLKAKRSLLAIPATYVCDALLDQNIFAGVGNIIKNEVLYRIRLHPETRIENIPQLKLQELIDQARQYSKDFLKWKRKFVLKKNWLVHTKKICGRCDLPLLKKYCGKTQRRTFFCSNCQKLYRKK